MVIVGSALAVFVALCILLVLAIPGRRVSKRRLGIERERVSVGRSVDALLERHGKRRGLAQALVLADITVEPGQFALRVFLVAVLTGVLGLFLGGPVLALVAFAVPFLGARVLVRRKGVRRQDKFAEQLPDVLQLLITSLRSGYGLNQALDAVAAEAEEPIRTEFQHTLAETRMGRDLSEALRAMAVRMASTDLDWVVGAVEINRETGGNLAETLENLGETLRARGA